MDHVLDPDVMATLREVDSSGSPDFTIELIELFMQEVDSRAPMIRDAARCQDRQALKATIHSLKGSSSTMGAQRLAAACAEIENRMAESSGSQFPPMALLAIDMEIIQVREALIRERQMLRSLHRSPDTMCA